MLKRLAKDESGIALGLAVIMIVLIGVMGAGLLVFVRNDLQAVVEVNQGQRAFEAADAGVQAARRQLLSDATANDTTNIYDTNTGNGNSPWSAISGGKNLTFDSKTVNVKIQYLLPSDTSTELTDPNHAPELVPSGKTDYPEPKDFFKITSEGTAGGTAKRKVEAIYVTEDMSVPKGYYTPCTGVSPGDPCVEIKGNATISGVSIFALGNVKVSSNSTITGEDAAYKNWCNPPFNTTSRGAGSPCTAATGGNTAAGIGATGTIDRKVAGRDFDATTTPRFIQKTPPDSSQTTGEMSFPFDYALPDIDFLRDEALKQEAETGQDHYIEVGNANGTVISWPDPPAGSDPARTVVFYKFTTASGSNNLDWKVGSSCSDAPKEGTLVVENGDFTTQPNRTPFKGAVVIRGGEATDGSSADTGNTCLQGYVNASGAITIAGNVSPMAPADLADKRPGWYGVRLWSWRELYQ